MNVQISKVGWIRGEQRWALTSALVAEYAQGVSIRELAKAVGRSYSTVHRLLSEAGVTFRPRGGYRRPSSGK